MSAIAPYTVIDRPAPPHSEEVEQALLAVILRDSRAWEAVAETARPAHFYYPVHGRIYEAMGRLVEAGHQDLSLRLPPLFEADPDLAEQGAKRYFARLAAAVVSTSSAADYAQQVRDLYLRRELIAIGDDLAASARQATLDTAPPDLITEIEARLYSLVETTRADQGGPAPAHDAMAGAMAAIDRAQQAEGGITGVATGIAALDAALGGLQAGDLVIAAGRPGMGKTILGVNIAENAAARGEPVLMFSLEMARWQIAQRQLARRTGITVTQQRHRLSADEHKRLALAHQELGQLPLWIDDTPGLTIAQVRSRARRHKRRYGCSLLVVDYLQLTRPTQTRSVRVHEIEEISNGLKNLARELGIPVLALSQLSRAVESRDDKRPTLADLRDGGSLEQDADVVAFLYRHEYYLRRDEPKGKPGEAHDKLAARMTEWGQQIEQCKGRAEIILAKVRQGQAETLHVSFDSGRMAFDHDGGRYQENLL